MTHPQETTNATDFIRAAALFLLLAGFYLLTYRGFPLSQDEYFILDSTESFVRRGDFYRTYEFSLFNTAPTSGVPWGRLNQEPLASVLVAPFFWLGQNLPNVGTVHVTWLFNIVVTALTGVSVFLGARLLRYDARTAWIAGLAYGLGTIAWTYSRHLFREPIMTFFVLWCFVLALYIRQLRLSGEGFSWRAGVLLALCFLGAFLTKAASILILPGLVIILLPSLRDRRVLLGLGALSLLILVGVAVIISSGAFLNRYSLDYWQRQIAEIQVSFLLESFLGYQVSIGRSLWLHSPVLILGLGGAVLLLRRGMWRVVLGPALTIVLLSASYGIAHETSWWGSWGWGPRYMLPLTPMILMVWVLPVLMQIESNRLLRYAFWTLLVLGAGVQLLGMSVPMPNYYTDLNRAGILAAWDAQPQWAAYNWSWEWSPIRYHLERFDLRYIDFAWRYAEPVWLALVLGWSVILGAIGLGVWAFRRDFIRPLGRLIAGGLAVLLLLAVGLGLRSIYLDSRYIGEWTDVYELTQLLEDRAAPSHLVFVDRDQYLPLFMNYFKTPALTANLPYAPGEDYGSGPEVISDDPVVQIGQQSVYALEWAKDHYADTWLVASSGPFQPEKIRPIERYMVENTFPVEAIDISQRARAIRFFTASAPGPGEPPSSGSPVIFDERLVLEGYDLPMGQTYQPGDVVPVSLVWRPLAPLPEDYNISVQVAAFDGFPLAQRDGQPQATFGATTQWPPDAFQRDNHGIQLPDDIPPGNYVIQVIVYRWQDGYRLPYTAAGGGSGDIAQITQITVQ